MRFSEPNHIRYSVHVRGNFLFTAHPKAKNSSLAFVTIKTLDLDGGDDRCEHLLRLDSGWIIECWQAADRFMS